MRLTLKEYEKAKKAVEDAKAHREVVKTWDDAMKKIGPVGNQKVLAISIKDGKITTKCEFDETADRPMLQKAEK